jgi:DGQHR domain-containing protein
MESDGGTKLRYSISLVTQGKHRFYTLTMPSDVLARTCFVTSRDEDPKEGFQRVLDTNRAQQIADYIDVGFGTIPSSIVLSAQPEAEFRDIAKGKTVEFKETKRAFLVLDGQHRVYGFSLAKTTLRVPVVIYNGLSRQDETRLFIDINTKQRPVPNELLLDIKKLAEIETDQEQLLGELFDSFANENDSPLFGLMSPSTRSSGKISRVTFNAALKPLIPTFGDTTPDGIYDALRAYLRAFFDGAANRNLEFDITNPILFRAVVLLFPEVARRVKDRFAANYTVNNFRDVIAPIFATAKKTKFKNVGSSYKVLQEDLLKTLQTSFVL